MITDHIEDQPIGCQPCESSLTLSTLIATSSEPRVDTRQLAQHLQNKHQSLFELIKGHRSDFEELGLLRFQTGKATGGRPEKFAMLNEDQATLALTYSKNTKRVRELKVKLVKAFGDARRAAQIRKLEYMPAYRQAHDQIKILANGAPGEHFDHMNLNRLLNKVVGIESGQRASAPEGKQALLTVCLLLTNDAMKDAPDSKTAYHRAKEAVQSLQRLAVRSSS